MNARDTVLATLRSSLGDFRAVERPRLQLEFVSYSDLVGQFISAAGELPAAVIPVKESVEETVQSLPVYRQAERICSFVEAIGSTAAALEGPHAAADLDLSIARGNVGIAESGAIWVDGAKIEPRSALFLAQHLVLILDRTCIVPHLHAAYERIDVAAHAYGAFIAGPSKTADIEQALVVGAHGPRSLTIVLS